MKSKAKKNKKNARIAAMLLSKKMKKKKNKLINFKVNDDERKKLKEIAKLFFEGKLSKLLREAALNYRPHA